MTGIVIVLIIALMITALALGPVYFRSQERQKLQETLRAAIERGEQIPPDVIGAMTSNVRPPLPPKMPSMQSPQRDLRIGIVWLGVAAGIVGLALALSFDEPDWTWRLLGIACFPGFIGLAFVLVSFLGRDRKA